MLRRVFILKFTADSEMIWCGNQKGKQSGLSALFCALFTMLMKDSLKGFCGGTSVWGTFGPGLSNIQVVSL
jgi:hypothetical protein